MKKLDDGHSPRSPNPGSSRFTELPDSESAWLFFFLFWYEKILCWAMKFHPNLTWAEEATVEVFFEVIKALQKDKNLLARVDNLESWLRKIARRVFLRKIWREKKHGTVEGTFDEDVLSKIASAESEQLCSSDLAFLRLQILFAMNVLNVKEQDVLLLYYWEGLSIAQIAPRMGISPVEVTRLKFIAQRKLKRHLEHAWHELFCEK